MHPACKICGGACCKFFAIWKSSFKPDVAHWLSLHGTDEGKAVIFPVACSKLEDGKCSIYEDRPQMCRDGQVGATFCLDSIKRYAKDREAEILKAIEVRHGT